MSTVPNPRLDPGSPYDGRPEFPSLPAGYSSLKDAVEAPGDVAWFPPASQPMTREALFLRIARAIAAGAPAPASLEFESRSHGPELELKCAENDRTGVSLYADLFELPLPRESGWTRRQGAREVRSFGASSVLPNPPEERDLGEPAGPQLFHGWIVAVYCDVDAEPPLIGPVAGTATVAPQHVEVPV